MPRMISRALTLALALAPFAVLVACGDAPPAKAPATPGSAGADPSATAPPDSAPSPPPQPEGPVNGAPADAAPAPQSSTGEPPKTGQPQVISGGSDECTPVGVDFEKRARPKLKECYAAGKKKDPNLEGTVKIKLTIDVKGKLKTVKVIEKTLPNPVADCMLGVVKSTPFPEVEKCWDSTITIPITFPTPR